MLMYEVSITKNNPGSFLEPTQIVSYEKKLPKVCRLLQYARETNSDFEVNAIEIHPEDNIAKSLLLLSSETYRELGIL